MWDRIKYYAKIALGFVVAVLVGVIYVLTGQKRNLQTKVGELEAKERLGEVLTKKEEAEHEANDAEADYNRVRNEYLNSTDGTGGQPKA